VDVTINDRGPYIAGRIIDLSRAAAGLIGLTAQGIARVTVEVLGR
jgi:rare lipoprotein A